MQCPNCGHQNQDTFRFCLKCGSALTLDTTNTPRKPEPVVQEAAPAESMPVPAPVVLPVEPLGGLTVKTHVVPEPASPAIQILEEAPAGYQEPVQPDIARSNVSVPPAKVEAVGRMNAQLRFSDMRMGSLGTPVRDGGQRQRWSALLPDADGQAENVLNQLDCQLKRKPVEGFRMGRVNLISATNENRSSYLVQSLTGTNLLVLVYPFGKDLYLSWDVFSRPALNLIPLGIMTGLAGLLALISAIIDRSLLSLPLAFLAWAVLIFGAAAIYGKYFQNSPWALILKGSDPLDASELDAMGKLISDALVKSVEAVGLDSTPLPQKNNAGPARPPIF